MIIKETKTSSKTRNERDSELIINLLKMDLFLFHSRDFHCKKKKKNRGVLKQLISLLEMDFSLSYVAVFHKLEYDI